MVFLQHGYMITIILDLSSLFLIYLHLSSLLHRSLSSIVIGSPDPVTLNMHISNNGDDAFQASLKAHIPKGLQFIRTEVSESLVRTQA